MIWFTTMCVTTMCVTSQVELLEDDDDLDAGADGDEDAMRSVDGRPAWMRTLHASVKTWLDLVPKVRHRYILFTRHSHTLYAVCPACMYIIV